MKNVQVCICNKLICELAFLGIIVFRIVDKPFYLFSTKKEFLEKYVLLIVYLLTIKYKML